MTMIPESEIPASVFVYTGEKRSEILAKHFAGFRLLISRESGSKKFHEKSSTFSTRDEIKFFHREILGVRGPKTSGKSKVLVFVMVWSFNMHAPYILSTDDLGDFSGVL